MALTNDDRERIALGHAMERLVALPEWTTFCEWIQAHPGNDAFKRVIAPAASIDACLQGEFEKGTLKGIELTLTAPTNIIAEMQKILADEASNANEDDDDYPRRTVNYDGGDGDSRPGFNAERGSP